VRVHDTRDARGNQHAQAYCHPSRTHEPLSPHSPDTFISPSRRRKLAVPVRLTYIPCNVSYASRMLTIA
jgi:hypothetical protein